jgi:hypothetical protein
MTGDWRDFRPAIWVAMLGVALLIVLSSPAIGVIVLGGAIGLLIRITQRRRAIARNTPPSKSTSKTRRRK